MPFHPPIPQPDSRPKPKSALASLAEAEKMVQVALLLPSSAFVGWIFGALLDRFLHQNWISLVGIIFGGISGIVYVVQLVLGTTARPGARAGRGAGSSGDRP
jgi:ATP synthase protein I